MALLAYHHHSSSTKRKPSSPAPTPPPPTVPAMKLSSSSQHSPYFNLIPHHLLQHQHTSRTQQQHFSSRGGFLETLCYSWWFVLVLLLVFVISTTESYTSTTTPATGVMNCSVRQLKALQFDDAGAKAYISQVVFKGLIKARTPVDQDGMYEASFLIQQTIKGLQQLPRKKRRRVKFAMPSDAGAAGGCKSQFITANLETNMTYLVFADRAKDHQLRALSPPLPATRRHEDAVERSLCPNCVRPPRVSGLQDLTIRPKQKLKLTCHYEGNPLPLIEWYRRGRRIEPSRRARINTRRRKSVLAITRTTRNDTGRYECRAVSVTDERVSIAANVSVSPEIEPENRTSQPPWPLADAPCPITSYCLNGGTCLYYEAVGELVCECAEGYKGQRCENKDVYNRGTSVRGKMNSLGRAGHQRMVGNKSRVVASRVQAGATTAASGFFFSSSGLQSYYSRLHPAQHHNNPHPYSTNRQ